MAKTASQKSKSTKSKKSTSSAKRRNSKLSVYSSLVTPAKTRASKRQAATAKKAREKARAKAELPKDPWGRFWEHFRWSRIKAYWFSKAGLKRILKIIAAIILLGIIALGILFFYYRQQIASIDLSQINVAETVNTYLDRNGNVLWEDVGDDNYRLVVNHDEISEYMFEATVAIEDQNFYNHPGVDFGALVRATLSTLSGHGVQGGSTLTQQLIKQIYFEDEAGDRTITGIPRKIKEMILALELEKMYSKDDILTMYLNQSPYGGRRNGVESAAQTYFGKSAKDLDLPEAALLAAIPNNPAVLNPYNEAGHEALVERQHRVLDNMVEMGYITQDEAEEAKSVDILDRIQPVSGQYDNIQAPHFVLEVKNYLEEKYGISTIRSGGYTIKTTLDLDAQHMAESAVAAGAESMYLNGSDNLAMVSVDVDTSQIIAMVGSVDFNREVYGEVNATTSILEPGSTIKPLIAYAPLFMQRSGTNYGPGSILRDENIDNIYCAGYTGSCSLSNSTGRLYGNITIRRALGNSLNIPAVKAVYINGIDNSLAVAQALGDKSYCEGRSNYGLSISIGSGCGVKMTEHANAYASLARGGTYKDVTMVLEVKDADGNVLESWQDSEGERVVDEQVAYMLSNILSDSSARTYTFGSQGTSYGFVVDGVWTASKTGTTTTTSSSTAKDSWMVSYSTAVATVVWNGNHDGRGLTSNTNQIVRRVVNNYMYDVHHNLYQGQGKWAPGDEPVKPEGIQTLTVNGTTDIWPSWYSSSTSGITNTTLEFNRYTYALAAECTPADQRIQVNVTRSSDPVSGEEVWSVPEPYNRNNIDDCSYKTLGVDLSRGDLGYTVQITGSGTITYTITKNGTEVESGTVDGTTELVFDDPELVNSDTIRVEVRDQYTTASDAA